MEAKDTVMTTPQLWDAYRKQPKKYEVLAAIEAQAEISFKAGYEKSESEFVYNPDYLDFQKGVEAGKITGKQAGIREVVEWIRVNGLFTPLKADMKFQAKLKEWGIE